ncbi:MAG TPA: hypothetical protein VGG06_11685 [Thermoanaerobaculia bacterium]
MSEGEKNANTVPEIWLKIANIRMSGDTVEFLVEGDAGDEREGTWLPCRQGKPEPVELYKMVLKALQDTRKTSGKLAPASSDALAIKEVRVQFQ